MPALFMPVASVLSFQDSWMELDVPLIPLLIMLILQV